MDFENDPKFKALSPAAQAIVRQRKATQVAPPQSNFEKAKALYSSYQQSPLYRASPVGMLNTVNDLVHKGANVVGEKTAVGLAERFPNLPPQVPAGIGTGIQMAPDAIMALMGGGGAKQAAEAGELGMAGRVISGPSRQAAGEAIGAAERAVGVNTDIVPTIKDAAANLGLKTANTKQYLNALLERLKSGEELGPQALSQHHKMVTEILSKEPAGAAKLFRRPQLGAPAEAQAAKINKLLVQRLNSAAPGRASEAANYGAAMLRNKLYKGAAATTAGAVLGKNAILNALSRLTGQ